MSQFFPDENAFSQLGDKVIVMTGAATGIGAATLTILASHGAHIVFGDTAIGPARELVRDVSANPSITGTISFQPMNVTQPTEVYALFKTAYDTFGRVDHAISSAGIFEQGNWFDPALDIKALGQQVAGPTAVIDVNVMGSANFARCAVVFMRESIKAGKSASGESSLLFLSSVNAFRESPGLYMYQTSKHAIHGLMRSMRKIIHERDGIRVNCVCPGVTETPMTADIIGAFKDANLYWQSPESVGKIIVGMVCARGMNGKGVYVEGGDGWEFEDSFYEMQPKWLGEEPTRRMRVNAEAVNKGALTKN